MFDRITPIVKNLLIINGLFFIATILLNTQGVDLIDLLGLHHWSSDKFQPYQFVTHFFMHSNSNFTHLFFNMFAVYMFGSALERVWGPKRFLIYYVVSALGAAVVYLLYITYDLNSIHNQIVLFQNSSSPELFKEFCNSYILPLKDSMIKEEYIVYVNETIFNWTLNPENTQLAERAVQLSEIYLNFKRDIPMVGASGAVFGLLLAFGMLFPNTELMLLFPPIPIKAKYFVIGYGAIELWMAFSNNPGDNVAHFAHLGGMLIGYILIKKWQSDRHNFY